MKPSWFAGESVYTSKSFSVLSEPSRTFIHLCVNQIEWETSTNSLKITLFAVHQCLPLYVFIALHYVLCLFF